MDHPGIILKQLRQSKGLTEAELIKKIYPNSKPYDTNILMIKAWEKGIANLHNDLLIRVAKFFNVSIIYLLGFNSH